MNSLAKEIRDNAEVFLELAETRLKEINKDIEQLEPQLNKLKIEQEHLSIQVKHLHGIITLHAVPEQFSPAVATDIVEDTDVTAPDEEPKKVSTSNTADAIYDILHQAYPRPMHLQGIHRGLISRGIGVTWRHPESSIYHAMERDIRSYRFKKVAKGEYTIENPVPTKN